MEFDFEAQFPKAKINKKQSKNLQEIMNDINNSSIDFDNFDPIDQNQSIDKSNTSELFNKPKLPSGPTSKQKSNVQFQQDTSRDIGQISLYFNNTNQSFHFQKSMSYEQPSRNERYQNLKKMLQKAKKNSLDAFYKNIQMAAANQKQPGNIVFENKNQFNSYMKDLKNAKKIEEDKYITKQASHQSQRPPQSKKANLFGKQGEDAFKKKYNVDFNILPPQFNQYDEEVDFFNQNQFQDKGFQQKQYQKSKFNQQRQEEYKKGLDFFTSNERNSSRPTSNKVSLQPIRQQKINVLDHSMQEKKLQQLLLNYRDMKNNFNNLIGQLKEANQNQYQLANQLRNVKGQYRSVLSVEERQKQKQIKERQKQQKKRQLEQIKNQIHQIKTNEKDLAYSKINQKLQQLENVVRVVIQQIAEEKTQKFTPKVINYYDDQKQKSQANSSRRDYQEPNLSRDSQNTYQNTKNPSMNASPKKTIKHQNSRSNLNNNNYRQTQKAPYSQNVSRELNLLEQFSSPLQLDLSLDANKSNIQSDDIFDIRFIPEQFGLQFFPLKIQTGNKKSFRNCLSQKSSILYQSFQFLIACRYTIIEDDKYPVIANIRVGNKCAIDLIDVFVIVYGPQGSDVEVTPNKIFQQKMKFNTNIQFQVRLDKRCIQDSGFSVQISYKTDSMTKKKINFKAVLPVIQLIKPQFIYQQNFIDSWELLKNQVYVSPKKLDFKQIRTHQDLKLLLPFIHITQSDPNVFSYGIMFKYPKCQTTFMLKIMCYINGKASIHLRADRNGDQKLKQQLLNVFNFLLFT